MEAQYRQVEVQSWSGAEGGHDEDRGQGANGYHLTQTGADAAGKPIKIDFTANYDGKDTPVTGVTNTDTIAVKRVDANTSESTLKKGGKVVMTVTSVVSKDGKTRTSTFKGTDANGKPVNNVAVYDKQ